VLKQLREAFRKLADMPGIGHFREDLLDQRYRFWSVHSYLIVYRWETKPLEIISIVHGARDLAAFFANRPT
jgi:antitoxin ParD1/3/4/toxin ParE1/3/4